MLVIPETDHCRVGVLALKRVIWAFIFLHFTHLGETWAQEPLGLNLGDRVRVTAPECSILVGQFEFRGLKDDSLLLRYDRGDHTCPLDAVQNLEVSLGKRHWWKSSLAGLGIGAAGGVTAGLFFFHCNSGAEDCSKGFLVFLGAVWGGLSGLVVGSLVGVARGSEGWRTVPLPPVQPYLNLSLEGGPGIGVSIRLRR